MSLGINSSTLVGALGNQAANGIYRKSTKGTEKSDSASKADSSSKSDSAAKTDDAKSSKLDRYVSSAEDKTKTLGISQTNESKLSSKAQDLLKKLREKYKDFDLYVGNTNEEQEKLSNVGSKDISVIFSADELEKMAADDKYANEITDKIDSAVDQMKKVSEKYSFDNKPDSEHGQITKIGITIGSDGTVQMFADLQKASLKQSERIKAQQAEKRVDAKKAAKEDAKAEKTDGSVKDKKTGKTVSDEDNVSADYPEKAYDPATVKFTTVKAGNIDDLVKAIENVNWDDISPALAGDRVDFTA